MSRKFCHYYTEVMEIPVSDFPQHANVLYQLTVISSGFFFSSVISRPLKMITFLALPGSRQPYLANIHSPYWKAKVGYHGLDPIEQGSVV